MNRATGNRLRQQLVDEESGDPVETSHTIDIDSFVPESQIDPRYLDAPYYLVPNEKVGQDAFAVIRDAMRGKGMVAIGRVVLAKRERIMMLRAWDKGLLGTTLRYAAEVRDTTAYFADLPNIQVAPDMLKLAEHILDSKRADFAPTRFRDRYEDALVSMLKAKQAGTTSTARQPEVRDRKVVDLMAALRASLAKDDGKPQDKITAKKPKGAAAMDKKRADGQRDMLLPISGSKTAKKESAMTSASKAKSALRKASRYDAEKISRYRQPGSLANSVER